MICNTPQELLSEIRRYMNLNKITIKELSVNMNKSHQSVSQYFANGNPKLENIFEICRGLNVNVDFNLLPDNNNK